MVQPYPLWTGSVIPDVRPNQPSAHVRVPQYWWDLADTINADTRPGKVLVLPLDDYYQMPTTWGFAGVDSIPNLLFQRPTVQPKPDGYFGDVPGFAADVRAVETALLSGDLAAVPRLLEATGISQVVVRHDLVRGMPGRTFADDRVLDAALAQTPGHEPGRRGRTRPLAPRRRIASHGAHLRRRPRRTRTSDCRRLGDRLDADERRHHRAQG